jgi:hypothetical protein
MCSTNAGPHRNEKMDLAEARIYLDQARELADIKKLIITGGEPLLFFDEIVEVLAYARSLGLITKVVTNAFWADSEENAVTKLEDLRNNGLDYLSISTDRFHQEFVPIAYVRHALKAAIALGVPRDIGLVTGESDLPNIWSQISSLGNQGEFYFKGDFMGLGAEDYAIDDLPKLTTGLEILPLQRFGRGEEVAKESILRSLDELNVVTCPVVGRTVSVLPGGDVFWCCCVNGQNQEIHEFFKIGNLKNDKLKNLDDHLESDLLCDYIAFQGPVNLLKDAVCMLDLKQGRNKFTCMCDVCTEAFRIAGCENLTALARKQVLLTKVIKGSVLRSSERLASVVKEKLKERN